MNIETRNNYLRIALEHMNQKCNFDSGECIIDLTSFNSLRTIMRILDRNRKVSSFIFIGGAGLYSKILSQLVSLEFNLSVHNYCSIIQCCPRVTYDDAIDFILSYKTLGNFSRIDKITVHSLLLNDTMTNAAKSIGTTPKAFYHRVDTLVKKLNMQNRMQTYQFFRREFHPDYVRQIIEESTRY